MTVTCRPQLGLCLAFAVFTAALAGSLSHSGECTTSPDGSEQADALLQQTSRRGSDRRAALAEDSEQALDSEARAAVAGTASRALGALLSDSSVGSVRAEVAEGGGSARVIFRHGGRAWDYHLTAFSVYADDAELLAHTASGVEKRPLPSFASEGVGTFRARVEHNEHGLWANAVIKQDGSVTGLFQLDDGTLRLEPLDIGDGASSAAALIEAAGAKGVGNPHQMQRIDVSALLVDRLAPAVAALQMRQGEENATNATPCVKVDGECVHDGGDDGKDGIDHVPHMGPNDSEAPLLSGTATWDGTKWWPGCYSGDSDLHEFKVGVVVDHDGFEEHGSQVNSKMQAMFTETSFVYEHQFHTKLSIGYQKVYESSSGAPSYAVGCSPVLKLSDFKGRAASDMPSGLGASHLFTGCGTGYGTVGRAWIGTICRTDGYATGVNQFHKTKDWLIFAHELGHNFDGAHSFEEGQGSTGGIMDYGDGKLDGTYQFNTKYRKDKMCQKMNSVVNNCGGGFAKAQGGGGSPSPPSATPAPPPPGGAPAPPPPGGAPAPSPSTPAPAGSPLPSSLTDQLKILKEEIRETIEKVNQVQR